MVYSVRWEQKNGQSDPQTVLSLLVKEWPEIDQWPTVSFITPGQQIDQVTWCRSLYRSWGRIIEMLYDSVPPRLVILPRQVRWDKNSFMLIYLVKKSENES